MSRTHFWTILLGTDATSFRARDRETLVPTLKQLQYLVALHEHGHSGKAADSCFVSQSTLSAGLRELESLLGVTLGWLMERCGRIAAPYAAHAAFNLANLLLFSMRPG